MNLIYKVLVSIILLMTISCSSNELTREQAEELITDFYAYPNVEFVKTSFYGMGEYSKMTKCLREKGIVRRGGHSNGIILSDHGKNYQHPSNKRLLVTNERKFKEVTGIKYLDEKNTKATIEYSDERYHITDVGVCAERSEGQLTTYTLNLALFDDGWRVDAKEYTNFKSFDFPLVQEFIPVAR